MKRPQAGRTFSISRCPIPFVVIYIASSSVAEVCSSGPMKKATISGSTKLGLFMNTWHIFDG